MGQTLSEPVTTKQTKYVCSKDVIAASSCMQGWRVSMEDAHVVVLGEDDASFFAVFDGHGGQALAQHVSKAIHPKIMHHQKYKDGQIQDAIIDAHLELDYEMSYDPKLREESSGTTSISVLIKSDNIYCANIGDSRAIASVDGRVVVLSRDHKPSDADESERIIAAGGWVEFNRVNGNLALSRAFGDYVYKRNSAKRPEQQMVTARPDVVTQELTSQHEFLVLACDGIWDVMTNFEVIRFIRTRIALGNRPEKICEELIDTCLAPDCRMGGLGCDNMTVVLVCFLHGNGYSHLSSRCRSPMKPEEEIQRRRSSTPNSNL